MISVIVPVMGKHEITARFLEYLYTNTHGPFELVMIDNGSKPMARLKFWKKYPGIKWVRNNENIGMVRSMEQGYNEASGDILFYTHNDVFIYEPGWDTKVTRIFHDYQQIGVAGFGGAPQMAKGMGRVGFASSMQGYHLTSGKCLCKDVSSCSHRAEVHGRRLNDGEELMPAAILDGFSLICRRKMLDEAKARWGSSFDQEYLPHHMYDADICLRSLDIGYKNAVINVKLDHLGGQTAVFPEYQEWARLLGGDAFFHKRNHEIFNAKWGARLGVIVMPDWRVEWKV